MSSLTNDERNLTFEEALTRTGFGAYSFIMTALSGVIIISFCCVFYSSTIIVPLSACELSTTGAQQGALMAGPIVGAIVGAVAWGYTADRCGRKNTLIASLLIGATINAAASLSVNWMILLTLQFTASFMISGQYSLAMTILSESVPIARRNLVILLVTSIFLLSQGIMAALAIPIIPLEFTYHVPYLDIKWNTWRTLLLVYSTPSALSALWLSFMQKSPKFVYTTGNETEALDILKVIHDCNNRKRKHMYQVSSPLRRDSTDGVQPTSESRKQIKELFKAPLLKYTIIMTMLFVLDQLAAFKMWLPTIAHRYVQMIQNGQSSNLTLCGVLASSFLDNSTNIDITGAATCALDFEALVIVIVVSIMLSSTNAFVTMFVGYFGRRNMVIVINLVSGLCTLLVNLVPDAKASAALHLLQLMGIVVIGLYTALAVALFPTHLRAFAVTLTMTGSRVASFISIQIINYLLVNDCELAFYIYGSLVAFSAVIAWFLPQDSPKSVTGHQLLQENEI